MTHLFNSKGQHIATEHLGHLYSTEGDNIGHFVQRFNLFIDLKGFYLGEIFYENRLFYNTQNQYIGKDFGEVGEQWDINNEEQWEIDPIKLAINCKDIQPQKLR